MRKLLLILLCLLLSGCSQDSEPRQTTTIKVLVQETDSLYMYFDDWKDTPTTVHNYMYAYDSRGNLVEARTYYDDELTWRTVCSYDENNNLIEEKSYDCSDLIDWCTSHKEMVYDDQGRVTETIYHEGWFQTSRSVTVYDDQARTSQTTSANGGVTLYTYNENGDILTFRHSGYNETGEVSFTEYTYSEDGLKVSSRSYVNDVLTYSSEWFYDELGREIKSVRYDADGSADYVWEYEYDDEANTETIYYPDRLTSISYFDDEGDVILRRNYDAHGNLTSEIVFRYRTMTVPVS